MNLRDLEYLVALADAGSFRKAAVAVGVSQPTLSTQVKKLEGSLGVALVERGTTPARLTPAGVEVVARARVLLADAEQLRQAAAAHIDPGAGTLRLGTFPTLGPYLLPHVVPGIVKAFPELTLLLTEEKTAELLTLLDAGQLDAALVALPDAGLHRVAKRLFREEFVLAAPKHHPLVAGELVPASAMVQTEVLVLAPGHCLATQVGHWVDQVAAVRRTDYQASTLESLRATIAAGAGVTLLPALAVVPPVVPNRALTLRRLSDPVPHRDIALVWRPNSAHAALLERLAPTLVPRLKGDAAQLIEPLP